MVNERFGDNAAHPDAAAGGQTATKPPPSKPPAWFRKNQAKAAAPRRRTSVIAVAQEPEKPGTWPARLQRWLRSFAATGYGLSLLVHAALLAVMALIVFDTEEDIELLTQLDFQELAEQRELVDVAELSYDLAADAEDPEPPELQTFDTKMDFPDVAVPQGPATPSPSAGDGEGEGSGPRRPGNAVTKGSFTVWTNPEDPDPRQPYHIIIEVKIPKGKRIRRYPRRDLVGTVVGTDSYRKSFPTLAEVRNSPFLPVRDAMPKAIERALRVDVDRRDEEQLQTLQNHFVGVNDQYAKLVQAVREHLSQRPVDPRKGQRNVPQETVDKYEAELQAFQREHSQLRKKLRRFEAGTEFDSGRTTRLVIFIPGAVKNVKDVIKVRSVRILKEQQTIELVF